VLSVEPTNAADCLEDSLRLNGITNATCARCAVSEKKGTIELVQYPGFNGVSHSAAFSPATFGQVFIKLLWPRSQSEPVKVQAPCKPFDDILQENKIDRVDFLKVDCEGGEYALFDGTSDATLAKVQRVALEFHELDPSHDYRRIVKRLEDAGFQVKVKRTLIERLFLQTGMIWAIRV
jgi:FkbM family methyltransferase